MDIRVVGDFSNDGHRGTNATTSKTKSGKDVALYWVMEGSAMMKGP